MRTVVLRVVALALLLLLTLVAVIALRTLQRVPDTVIYLVRSRGTTMTLEPVNRRLGRLNPEERARLQVAELAKGPSADEAARGLGTSVPLNSTVLAAELRGGELTVSMSAAFERGGGSASMAGRLAQLFYTLTQPGDVDSVVLQVEGETAHVFSGDGFLVEVPWVRGERQLPVW